MAPLKKDQVPVWPSPEGPLIAMVLLRAMVATPQVGSSKFAPPPPSFPPGPRDAAALPHTSAAHEERRRNGLWGHQAYRLAPAVFVGDAEDMAARPGLRKWPWWSKRRVHRPFWNLF